MSWMYQPDRLSKGAPKAAEKHARTAERETAYRTGSTAARRRDGGRCRLCGDHRNLETHHVRPRSLVGKERRDRIENLLTLCATCHQDVTKHIVKLYPGPEGANGLIRVERWHQPKGQPGEYRLVREQA